MTDFSTSRKHSMDYVTADGITLRTGYSDKPLWYLVAIRELLDNAADFLWKYYLGSSNAAITVDIYKSDQVFRLKVRNSNDNDIHVFSDAEISAIFDFEGRYGSKQDVHIIFRGMLGDALKQILAFGYALLHVNEDGSTFIDKQWDQPLIIRHNKSECKYILEVDTANQRIETKPVGKREFTEIGTDTEIELTLPVIDEVNGLLTRSYIEQFCRKYPTFTSDISFKFSIIDDSSVNVSNVIIGSSTASKAANTTAVGMDGIAQGFITSLTEGPPRAKKIIEFPALHPISRENWNKTDSRYSYKPEEFSRRLLNIGDESVIAYDVLRKWREGSNLAKNKDNDISIGQLRSMSSKDRGNRVRQYYNDLKSKLPPPDKISLPHERNKCERIRALMARVAGLYEIDKSKSPAYKAIDGYYKDSVIEFPFYFEIFAIPFSRDLIARNIKPVFIGAVNYSISPKENGNIFEGAYEWFSKEWRPYEATDIIGILEKYKFYEVSPKGKIPCVILANLVTPRRDPHGQDKSRIDTRPFVGAIIEAVGKVAPGIQTFRADNWKFKDEDDPYEREHQDVNPDGKSRGIRSLMLKFLREYRAYPG